jgi:ubiquitin carboxyl-terminal hydrolase 7
MNARDIGYAAFHQYKELYDPLEGFYVNHVLKFRITFKVTQSWVERPEEAKSLNGKGWNSKLQTGFVGLQNQGATCYLNSLLQSLYHIPRFRHLVYSIKVEANSSAASLQRLFWNLEHDDDSVATNELTKSFGWNIEDIAVQHDVQELLRKLVDKLEEKVKDGPQKGVFEQLFRGTYMDILKCINVDYERRQEIAFCDLSLNVAGCDTLEDSLRKFTETETLDGDNRYKSEEHGYQDAHKGIKLNALPPVLHLHLKRFDFQYQNDPPTLEKVNAKQVFPPVLKMGEFLDKPVVDSDETTYDLFGVLVHSGSAQAGHYYAFMRPTIEPNWFKFDDSKVSHAEVSEAIDDNFGGDEITEIKIGGRTENAQRFATEKHSSAYMLVYVKRTDIQAVFSDARLDSETAFVEKMTREMEQMRLEEQKRIEALQYTQIRVFTLDSLADFVPDDYDGKSMPIFDYKKAKMVSIKKDELVKQLKVEIDKQLGIPASRQRLWSMREYDFNYSLERPISVENSNRSITMFRYSRSSVGADFSDVFVEINDEMIPTDPVALESESQPQLRVDEENDGGDSASAAAAANMSTSAGPLQKGFQSLDGTRLIFVRFWNPETLNFLVIGQCYFPEIGGTLDLLKDAVKPLLERAGKYEADLEMAFFLSEYLNPISDRLSNSYFAMHALSNGTFLTVQYLVPEDATNIKHKLFIQYLRFLRNRVTLEFHDLSNRDVESIPFAFTVETTMGEVLATLGSALQWNPKNISLTDVHAGTLQPRTNQTVFFDEDTPISRAFQSTIYMASYGAPVHVFYDLLDLPLSEIRGKSAIKVHFVDKNVTSHLVTLYLSPPVIAMHVLDAARQHPRVQQFLSSPDIGLRLFEFDDHRFTYRSKHHTESIMHYYPSPLGIEEIYPEENNAPHGSSRIIIFLMHMSSSRVYTKATHRPFTMSVGPDETIGSVKERIRGRLNGSKKVVGDETTTTTTTTTGKPEEKEKDEIEAWLKDPAFIETPACEDSAIVSELDAQALYCHIQTPRTESTTTTTTQTTTTTTTTTKEKPRNALHLGD